MTVLKSSIVGLPRPVFVLPGAVFRPGFLNVDRSLVVTGAMLSAGPGIGLREFCTLTLKPSCQRAVLKGWVPGCVGCFSAWLGQCPCHGFLLLPVTRGCIGPVRCRTCQRRSAPDRARSSAGDPSRPCGARFPRVPGLRACLVHAPALVLGMSRCRPSGAPFMSGRVRPPCPLLFFFPSSAWWPILSP